MKNGSVIDRCDLTALTKELMVDGILQVKPYSFFKNIDSNELKYFMHKNAIYVMPTTELVEWFRQNIIGKAIEIGAGHGAISRALGIPITDSRMQELLEIKMIYLASGQTPITYAQDVEKLDAIEAIEKYKPDTVIGAFITHKYDEKVGNGNALGVQEELILAQVKRYIIVCNMNTHKDKPILKYPHVKYKFEWIVTRAVDQNENAILMFNQ